MAATLRPYEVMIIIDADLEEETIRASVERWLQLIEEKGAERGHVEVRWSHGRFRGAPEAKVYLDTPHADVPGYSPLV